MIDNVSEMSWRAISRWDVSKPVFPELIPGLPAENARRITEFNRQTVEYRLCKTERLLHGILIQ